MYLGLHRTCVNVCSQNVAMFLVNRVRMAFCAEAVDVGSDAHVESDVQSKTGQTSIRRLTSQFGCGGRI